MQDHLCEVAKLMIVSVKDSRSIHLDSGAAIYRIGQGQIMHSLFSSSRCFCNLNGKK